MSREGVWTALKTDLHSSVGGRSLCESNLVPNEHQWVAEATGLLSSANHIGAVKVWGNLLPSAVHAAKGRPNTSVLCATSVVTQFTGSHPTSMPLDSWLKSC